MALSIRTPPIPKAIKAVEREAVERYAEAMAVGEAAIRRDEEE